MDPSSEVHTEITTDRVEALPIRSPLCPSRFDDIARPMRLTYAPNLPTGLGGVTPRAISGGSGQHPTIVRPSKEASETSRLNSYYSLKASSPTATT